MHVQVRIWAGFVVGFVIMIALARGVEKGKNFCLGESTRRCTGLPLMYRMCVDPVVSSGYRIVVFPVLMDVIPGKGWER